MREMIAAEMIAIFY